MWAIYGLDPNCQWMLSWEVWHSSKQLHGHSYLCWNSNTSNGDKRQISTCRPHLDPRPFHWRAINILAAFFSFQRSSDQGHKTRVLAISGNLKVLEAFKTSPVNQLHCSKRGNLEPESVMRFQCLTYRKCSKQCYGVHQKAWLKVSNNVVTQEAPLCSSLSLVTRA